MGAAVSAAWVSQRDAGAPKPLDAKAVAATTVNASDVTDPSWLARALTGLLEDVAELKRRFAPNRITFRDIIVTGTSGGAQRITLAHRLGQLVEFWPVRAIGATGANPVNVVEVSQDGMNLTIDVFFTGTLWLRVEAAG